MICFASLKSAMCNLLAFNGLCCRVLGVAFFLNAALSLRADVNVTDFGAKGDLLSISGMSTVSNSTTIVCPTANFLATDINKVIQVFGGGTWRGTSNETLVAYIRTVSSPSTITVSVAAGTTAGGLVGVYGTDNTPCFQAAVSNCPVPTGTINVPAGNYLLLPPWQTQGDWTNGFDMAAIRLFRGGITFAGQGNVILTGNGGWKDDPNGYCQRGTIAACFSPFTNTYPLIFSNLTFYGGNNGYIGNIDYPAHNNTGLGWDGTHHALSVIPMTGGNTTLSTNTYIENCVFHGWRGENIINGNSSVYEYLVASNCVFYDGNATAFNDNRAHDWSFCTVSNMYQVEEFYRDYATAPSVVQNCLFTNLLGGTAIALNGGYYGCPTYFIDNNTLCVTNPNTSFLFTTPGSDVIVANNRIYGGMGISLGVAGYQDPKYLSANSNLLFEFNYFSNCFRGIIIKGVGNNLVENVTVVSNTFDTCGYMGDGYGWSTNVVFFMNVAKNSLSPKPFSSDYLQGEYFIDISNAYSACYYENGMPSSTNKITYGYGRLASMGGYSHTFYLDNAVGKSPLGVALTVTNWSSSQSYPIYLNSALFGPPATLSPNQQQTFYWNGFSWATNQSALTVNLGSGSGLYAAGTTITVTANPVSAEQFIGWSGATNILANPSAASTTATIPVTNAVIAAVYAPFPPTNLHLTN